MRSHIGELPSWGSGLHRSHGYFCLSVFAELDLWDDEKMLLVSNDCDLTFSLF